MRRYLAMLILGTMLAVWVLSVMPLWVIIGPWRLAKRLQRDLNG
jgi:hypothetical protein